MSKLPNIQSDFSQWYQEIIRQAELADQSPVRGTMIIMPYGYAIWENIKNRLDQRIKDTGHKNAAFPLFIPESFLKKEAEHVEGFAPELAVVTHAGGKKLEEPLVVRPTSETMIHYMFARWIHSWRDLPLKINQWANVVRWEMRPRAFLRTTEFFWQEGHTAHETEQEARQEVDDMMQEYVNLAQDYLAIPVVIGYKTNTEKFPGAQMTKTFEGLMPDGKALQMGTSHLLSQSFAKSFDMKFQDRDGKQAYPYLTSWGATTRLVGALIMTHGDQDGLVLPPKIAPTQVVIIPIMKKNSDNNIVVNVADKLVSELRAQNIRVELDLDEHKSPGNKFYTYELKGVPLRIEIGLRDIENQSVVCVDRISKEKETVSIDTINSYVIQKLDSIQKSLFQKAEDRLKSQWYKVDLLKDFANKLESDGGFYQTGWCESVECETALKEYKATIRCIIPENIHTICFRCQKPAIHEVLIARSY